MVVQHFNNVKTNLRTKGMAPVEYRNHTLVAQYFNFVNFCLALQFHLTPLIIRNLCHSLLIR
ncbi:IS3 family transposase [Limosilactobacillus agrestimuris]|uniref:IS3 family transposase n=1 Tax=Limosilactobacillus agrestimuris TaxID=2941331 RepID=UPI003B97BBA3